MSPKYIFRQIKKIKYRNSVSIQRYEVKLFFFPDYQMSSHQILKTCMHKICEKTAITC